MNATFEMDDGVLAVRIPATGIDPALLARADEDPAVDAQSRVHTVRIEAPPQWRWSSSDAAFLALLLRRLEGAGHTITLHGAPADLQRLLDLALRQPGLRAPPPAPKRGLVERVGAYAGAHLAAARSFVDLLGTVVALLPRLLTGRAQVRASEVVEVVRESSTRARLLLSSAP